LMPFGIALIIVSILGSIIGHFLVNVGLAIPFILLNNGDYLAAIVPEGKHSEKNIQEDEAEIIAEVIKETSLYDSLSYTTNLIRILKQGEKVKIEHINDQPDIGGKWALVKTETEDEGWCLLKDLEKK